MKAFVIASILVTGAAGLLGGEVCARLIDAGHRVTALVHRAPDVRANDGSAVPARTLTGDVSQPRFGWDDELFAKVAEAHDVVVHCAATVRFDLDEADYRAVNVDGVRTCWSLRAGDIAVLPCPPPMSAERATA